MSLSLSFLESLRFLPRSNQDTDFSHFLLISFSAPCLNKRTGRSHFIQENWILLILYLESFRLTPSSVLPFQTDSLLPCFVGIRGTIWVLTSNKYSQALQNRQYHWFCSCTMYLYGGTSCTYQKKSTITSLCKFAYLFNVLIWSVA